MGIDVKMVTGDAIAIARETSSVLGLGNNILDADRLGDAKHHEGAQADDAVEKADGFAQVFPSTNTISSMCCRATGTSWP